MLAELKERIVDWWLTKRTGMDKQTRAWEQWRAENIVFRANTVENMFMNFKHIIEVDPGKIMDMDHPFGWHSKRSFKEQYEYPHRELGDNAVWYWCRVNKDPWDRRWHFNDLLGDDHMFVATNNDEDAVMIALKYT